MTERQYQCWLIWEDLQWNVPDRHDWYLMQVAEKVILPYLPKGRNVRLADLKIPFKDVPVQRTTATTSTPDTPPSSQKSGPVKPLDKKGIIDLHKQQWCHVVGLRPAGEN